MFVAHSLSAANGCRFFRSFRKWQPNRDGMPRNEVLAMFESVYLKVTGYLHIYQRMLAREWHDMTPSKYFMLLLFVLLAGYMLMKSGIKRPGG